MQHTSTNGLRKFSVVTVRAKQVLLLLVSFWLCWAPQVAHAAMKVRYYEPMNEKDEYPIDLLKFILDSADADYELEPVPTADMTEIRQIADVNAGHVSFVPLAANKRANDALAPVPYPIFRGLLGHRVLLIREHEQSRFDQIDSISELQQLKGGQGRFWPDTQVLLSAGLDIETPVKYEGLFHMLEGGRFDFFPRGLQEPVSELNARPELELSIEESLLMVYPMPMFFYASKGNQEFVKTLSQGFENATKDGSFEKWFVKHPLIAETLSKIDLKGRTILRLENPHLPTLVPVEREELWLKL
ncbi:hypothetical protein [Echinimonas agarilytica]|uniref:Uncharacterized protein n=1 Tax=Echinimonas agarilytica TaxID=1215918 RepID=A0AA42B757_9GAMM|nr:hypothetical protein [Echinimonas agarilytica]MCM2679524.1 hypothetical protein [Echinimonas agarilytica]